LKEPKRQKKTGLVSSNTVSLTVAFLNLSNFPGLGYIFKSLFRMLETERLRMRKLTRDDLGWLIALRTDPDVSKYLGGTRLQNPEKIAERLETYLKCYEKLGFGTCGMIWKQTGEMIGFSGLQPLEDTGEIELGYSLAKEFWRMGIGYECASAWLRYGFETAGLERIVAIAVPENTGSWRIMEKCGMQYEKNELHYGMDVVYYAISKSKWQADNA
jgi:ribosomal-protein-alanine N-acetyltransferase